MTRSTRDHDKVAEGTPDRIKIRSCRNETAKRNIDIELPAGQNPANLEISTETPTLLGSSKRQSAERSGSTGANS